MHFNEYLEIIRTAEVPETLVFRPFIMWIHPENLPLGLLSIGDTDRTAIRVPEQTQNSYGNTVPVTAISAKAFAGNTRITDIILPSGIETIPSNAFSGCTALRNITIPKKLRIIEKGAFRGCEKLENIYYEGTPEEWTRVQIVHQKHEIEFGPLIPGTPVQHITEEREIHIPGNEAVFSANLHFRCVIPGRENK